MRNSYTRLLTDAAPQADADDRIVRFTFATDGIALDGHRILPGAWESKGHDGLKDFRANPVFLWAHDMSQPPVGKVITINERSGRLTGSVRFADHAFADTIYRCFRSGFMRGASVSWLPIEYNYARDKGREPGAIDFTKVRLLEISAVTVPSDSGALAEARSAGVNLEPLSAWARSAATGGRTPALRSQASALAGMLAKRPTTRAPDPFAWEELYEEAKKESARLMAKMLIYAHSRTGPSRSDLTVAAQASLEEFRARAYSRGCSQNQVAQLAAIFLKIFDGRLDAN
jgi:HK97 family phage prohead protease